MAEHARLFMHLTGASTGMIKGESVVMGRTGWIELDDWNWGMKRATRTAGAETVEPTKLTFSKLMDRATPAMLQAMRMGTELSASIKMDDASLSMLKLDIQFKRVRIIGYTVKTSSADKLTTIEEDWEFDYEEVVFEYMPNTRRGALKTRIERTPGSGNDDPSGVLDKFQALAKGIEVEELNKIWKKVIEKAEEEKKKKGKDAVEKQTGTF